MEGEVRSMTYKLKDIIKSEMFTGILLIIATVLSIYSGIQYFMVNKEFFLEDK